MYADILKWAFKTIIWTEIYIFLIINLKVLFILFLKYIPEFIKEYSHENQIRQSSAVQGFSLPGYPAYVVVYLVYVLAHDADFPSEDCKDERIFANFCR